MTLQETARGSSDQMLILPADISPAGRKLLKAFAAAAIERTFCSSYAGNAFKDVQDFGEVIGFAFRQADMMKNLAGSRLTLMKDDDWDKVAIAVPVPHHVAPETARSILDVVQCMGQLALRSRHRPVDPRDPWLYLYAEQGAPDNFAYQSGLLLRAGMAQYSHQHETITSGRNKHRTPQEGDALAMMHYENLLTIILNMAMRTLVANSPQFTAFHDNLIRIRQDDEYLIEIPLLEPDPQASVRQAKQEKS